MPNGLRAAILEAIREFDDLGDKAFFNKYGARRRAQNWFISHDGRLYDLKAIVHVARGAPQDFNPQTYAVRTDTENCGFSVVSANRAEAERSRRSDRTGAPRQFDLPRRIAVENAAIKCVENYYATEGYTCKSVEKDNKGWDLECRRDQTKLLVEVKGCSGTTAQAELTPNEYSAMKSHRKNYRLAIVTDALDDPNLLRIYFENGAWRDQDGNKLTLEERTGVRITT